MANTKKDRNIVNTKVTTLVDDVWLSTQQVAEMLGISRQAIVKSCKNNDGRYKGGVYDFKKTVGNGGEQYKINIKSLPEHIRAKHLVKTVENLTPHLQEINELVDIRNDFVNTWDKFNKKPDTVKTRAELRLRILIHLEDFKKQGFKQEDSLRYIESQYGIELSRLKVSRWKHLVLGIPKEHWLPYLAPDYKGRDKEEIYQPIWMHFLSQYLSQAKPAASVVYNEIKLLVKSGRWGDVSIPSCKTFINRLNTDIDQHTVILGREGASALGNALPHQRRDYVTSQGIHEMWCADGRTLDVFARWPDGSVSRPHMVMWMDIHTRMPLYYLIYTKTNSEMVAESFAMAMKRADAIPRHILLDNGREFNALAVTGGQRSRKRFTFKDDEVKGFTTLLGIEVHFSTVAHGQSKPIERLFSTLLNLIDKRVHSTYKAYVGKDPVSRPEDCNPDDAIPINELDLIIKQQINIYCQTPHRGHGMNGKSPLEKTELCVKDYQGRRPNQHQINLCRSLKRRLKLSDQYFFEFKLDGFGVVRYVPPIELNLKRGNYYDVSPISSQPELPALVFEDTKFIGEAHYEKRTPFLAREAAAPTMAKRKDAIAKSKNKIKQINNSAVILEHELSNLISFPQAPNIKPIMVHKPYVTTKTLVNGDVIDSQSGEILERKNNIETLVHHDLSNQNSNTEVGNAPLPDWFEQYK